MLRSSWLPQRVTFLEGRAGPLALLAVLQHQAKGDGGGGAALGDWRATLQQLLALNQAAVRRLPAGECEVRRRARLKLASRWWHSAARQRQGVMFVCWARRWVGTLVAGAVRAGRVPVGAALCAAAPARR